MGETNEITTLIRDNYDLLRRYTDKELLADMIYRDQNTGKYIYLPQVIQSMMDVMNANEIDDFSIYWFALHEEDVDFRRPIDGAVLTVLDFARVWLHYQIRSARTKISAEFGQDAKIKEKSEAITKVLMDNIIPVRDATTVTAIQFTKKDFVTSVLSYQEEFNEAFAAQKTTVKILETISDFFDDIDPVESFDWAVKEISYSLDIKLKREKDSFKYTPGAELDIFDSISTSERIPFCVLTFGNPDKSEPKRFFKMHVKDSEDMTKYMGLYDKPDPMTITIYINTGKRFLKKDIVKAVYSFKKGSPNFGRLTFSIPHDNVDIIRGYLNDHLKKFEVLESDPLKNVVGSERNFIVKGVNIDRYLFIHTITAAEPSNAVLLRYRETLTPASQKLVLKFQMQLFGQISIKIGLNKVGASTMIVSKDGLKSTLHSGENYLDIVVTSRNLLEGEVAKYVITRVISDYIERYDELFGGFYQPIYDNTKKALGRRDVNRKLTDAQEQSIRPVRIEPIVEREETQTTYDPEAKGIAQLKQVNPDMWKGSAYPRQMAPKANLQVIPIRESEIEMYRAQGRDVILWPVIISTVDDDLQAKNFNNRHWYTTSTEELKYITFVRSTDKVFPLYPKCNKEPTGLFMDDENEVIEINLRQKGRSSSGVATMKLLNIGQQRTGTETTKVMGKFLGVEDIGMIGIPVNNNSLLQCIFAALDPSYRQTFNEDELQKWREVIANFAILCKQENRFATVEEIAAKIRDPSVKLDSAKYYRAIEDVFEINLFTITVNKRTDLLLDPPQYCSSYVHVRNRMRSDGTPRPIIVVFKYKPKTVRDFHYELVFARNSNVMSYSFTSEIILKRLNEALAGICRTINVQPMTRMENGLVRTNYTVSTSDMKILEIPPELLSLDGNSKFVYIDGQTFDSMGKVRTVNIRMNSGILTFVSEPLEAFLTNISKPVLTTLSIFREFQNKFNVQNVSYVPQDDGVVRKLVGIWCTIGNIYGYVPINPTEWQQDFQPIKYEVGYSFTEVESPTQKLMRMQRVTVIYIQIIKRLYVLSGMTADDFVQNVMIFKQQHMDVSGADRFIPLKMMSNFVALKEHFAKLFPSLFYNGRIVYDSEETKQNILIRLRRFDKIRDDQVTLSGTSKDVDRFGQFLTGVFETVEDFSRHNPQEKIFLSLSRLRLEAQIISDTTPKVVNNIQASPDLYKKSPYFYLHQGRYLYMIQNVEGFNLASAQTVAKFWFQNNINSGYFTAPLATGIDVDIVDLLKFRVLEKDQITVLDYGERKYAALIRLS